MALGIGSGAGRPTSYNEDILRQANEYIDKCDNKIVMADGKINITAVNLPSIEGLAFELYISRSTLYLWAKEHEEFSDIIERLQQKQARMLMNSGLAGHYNSTISKVLLTKHGYTDKQEIDQKTEISGNFTGIQVVMPDAPNNKEIPS